VSISAAQPLLALLASPVGGNPIQYMIEKTLAFHDLDWRYLTFEVEPADLPNAVLGLRALGFRGVHCGDPHKQSIIPLLDRVTETAATVGVVNLAFRQDHDWVGDNTEGKGVVETIAGQVDLTGKRVVLLGAGRVARAVAVELAMAGIADLTIVHRTEVQTGEFVALLTGKFNVPTTVVVWNADFALPPDADLLIHATRLGQGSSNMPLPLNLETLRPEMTVADLTLGSAHTWLLTEAAQRGCKTVDGLSMFIHQVAIAFQLWTGVAPDRQVLREAVEEYWEL
jgi:shikimate dehydrogenase